MTRPKSRSTANGAAVPIIVRLGAFLSNELATVSRMADQVGQPVVITPPCSSRGVDR
jgi:hypothetical protein